MSKSNPTSGREEDQEASAPKATVAPPAQTSHPSQTTPPAKAATPEPPWTPPAHDGAAAPPPAHHKMRFYVTVAVLIVAAVLAAIYLVVAHQKSASRTALDVRAEDRLEQPPTVNVVKVELAPKESALKLPGQCSAFYQATVYARVNGYLQKWYFDIGDHVKAGDVLATVDTPDLDQELKVTQAKRDSLEADVKLQQAAVDIAKITSDRFASGIPEGLVSQQDADQKKAEWQISMAKLESSKAQVTLGEADVHRLQYLTGFKRVTAPFDGVVTRRYTDIGNLVTAGSTNNTVPLFTVARSDQIRVFTDVPQVARPGLTVGMTADVTAREFPGRIFHGRVDRTAEAINPASGTLQVEALVPNADGTLLPGMYVEVSFITSRTHPPAVIPAAALLLLSSGPHVAVVGSDDCVHLRPIIIGSDLGDTIEVADGLSGGESIALNLSYQITDGQKVAPVAINTKTAAAERSDHSPAAAEP